MDDVSSAVDSADATRQPAEPDRQPTNRRRRWLVLALALVLGGAFAVQATSTWRGGQAHHLADLALPALVLVLEVGAITGASIYVVTRNTGTRRRAGLLVSIVTGVGATFGVQAYGFLIGLPVAALLLLMVDLIGRFWHESASPDTAADSPGGTGSSADSDEPDTAGDGFAGPDAVDLPADEPEAPPLPEVRGVEPHVVAQAAELLAREPGAGRPRLRAYLSITDHRANLVLAALRPRPLSVVEAGETA